MLKRPANIIIRFVVSYSITVFLCGLFFYFLKKYRYNNEIGENWQYHPPGSVWDGIRLAMIIFLFVYGIYFLIITLVGEQRLMSASAKSGIIIFITLVVVSGFLLLFIDLNKIPFLNILPIVLIAALVPFIDKLVLSILEKKQ